MNAVYRQYFPRNKPVRTTVGVAGLPLGPATHGRCSEACRISSSIRTL